MTQTEEQILKDCFIVFEYYKLKIHSLYTNLNKIGNNHKIDSDEQSEDRLNILKRIIYYFHKAYKLQNDINRDVIKHDKVIDGYYLRNFTHYTNYFEYIHKVIISEFNVQIEEEEVNIDYEFILKNHSQIRETEDDEILEVGFTDSSVIDFDEEDENDIEALKEKFSSTWKKFKEKMSL